jgi:alkanesulfonate monooxygenase SsuD/methylene tetrahydromethanopterin reductase-like flavin-dependent oxidoreductase (luciferase family)
MREFPEPFGTGSVSVSLYLHDVDPDQALRELVTQAQIAEAVGFDGVTVSEHHGGMSGYLPNPLLAADWVLHATSKIWAAPCPLLLPLRHPKLVAEDIAWLAARFPDRVGAGVAPGSAASDFDLLGLDSSTRRADFRRGLRQLSAALSGNCQDMLRRDPAVARCRRAAVPLLSTAGGPRGVRTAAEVGAGLLISSSDTVESVRRLAETYRQVGGSAPILLNRRVWSGRSDSTKLTELERAYQRSGRFNSDPSSAHFAVDYLSSTDPVALARDIAAAVRSAGATAANMKLYYPGLRAEDMRDQLHRLGEVLPHLHAQLASPDLHQAAR